MDLYNSIGLKLPHNFRRRCEVFAPESPAKTQPHYNVSEDPYYYPAILPATPILSVANFRTKEKRADRRVNAPRP